MKKILAGLFGLWTDDDMINAHKEGWKSAYYCGEKQHQSSSDWFLMYYKERAKK